MKAITNYHIFNCKFNDMCHLFKQNKNIMISAQLRKKIIKFKFWEKDFLVSPMVHIQKKNRGWTAQIISKMDQV